jgi:hypothetical protein
MTYIASTGGINVMTYDLSDDEQYSECPEPGVCTLDQQVAFYMSTFATGEAPPFLPPSLPSGLPRRERASASQS